MRRFLLGLTGLICLASTLYAQQTSTFVYDPTGRRLEKSSGGVRTSFFVGGAYETTSGGGRTKYIRGPGGIVATITSEIRYPHADHLGSASVVTDGSGTEVARYLYRPYGELIRSNSTGLDAIRHKFTGQEQDDETNLQYYIARYRDPVTTLWMTADDRIPSEDILGYNRFGYVRCNPLKYNDPTGHSPARDLAVKLAWEFERQIILAGGTGTYDWIPSEIDELIRTGSVSGYEGHHINNVADFPELEANPDNIAFKLGREGHIEAHRGDWSNRTAGPLLDRSDRATQAREVLKQRGLPLRAARVSKTAYRLSHSLPVRIAKKIPVVKVAVIGLSVYTVMTAPSPAEAAVLEGANYADMTGMGGLFDLFTEGTRFDLGRNASDIINGSPTGYIGDNEIDYLRARSAAERQRLVGDGKSK